jgi:hypothetical protein
MDAGGCGKFIMFITITMIIAMTSGGLLVDGLPLLQMSPVYYCYECPDSFTEKEIPGFYSVSKGGSGMCNPVPGSNNRIEVN